MLMHVSVAGSNSHNNGGPAGDGQAGDAGEGQRGRFLNRFIELEETT